MSFGADVEPEGPLARNLRSVMMECGHSLAEKRPDPLAEILLRSFGDAAPDTPRSPERKTSP